MIIRARIESGSRRNESIQYGTSANVETIPCASYREEILKNNESLTIPFDVRCWQYFEMIFQIGESQNEV